MPARHSLSIPPLYAIFDPELIKARSPELVVRELLETDVKIVQLRAKAMNPRDFLQLARETGELTRSYDCLFIVNDRVDIALACNADGVHLGQEDLPLHAARKLMGDKIIGISTHDLEQARDAEQDSADYIGFGPMFGSKTKDTGYIARGLPMLNELRQAVKIPIVAIGGIIETNVAQVWHAGADSAAIISDILRADDIAAKIKRINEQHVQQ
jgi:thiamine-phosphate diphosphorylase